MIDERHTLREGFQRCSCTAWRDINPSGAAFIQWFNEYRQERDPEKLKRILDYNEDDCQAMAVLTEG